MKPTKNNMSTSDLLTSIIGSGFGNVVEWYSFMAYAYLAPVLATLFFPHASAQKSILMVYLIFAAGFLARPFGALFFGYIGDKFGRKQTLIVSQCLMAIPSLLICFIPTYNSIGILAPILMSVIRFIQGFSIAGEYTTSLCYLAEVSPAHRKGIYTSVIPASTAFGILISSFITLGIIDYFTQHNELLTIGWRVCFFIGFVLNLAVILIRFIMKESEEYSSQKEIIKKTTPKEFFTILTQSKNIKSILIVVLLVTMIAYFYQLLYIWAPNFYEMYLKKSTNFSLTLNGLSMIIFTISIIIGGHLYDSFNKKKIMLVTLFILFIVFYPMFYKVINIHSNILIYSFMFIISAAFGIFYGATSAFFSLIFPVRIRSTALSLSFNIPYAIIGGLTPVFLSTIYSSYSYMAVIYVTTGISLLAIVATFFIKQP